MAAPCFVIDDLVFSLAECDEPAELVAGQFVHSLQLAVRAQNDPDSCLLVTPCGQIVLPVAGMLSPIDLVRGYFFSLLYSRARGLVEPGMIGTYRMSADDFYLFRTNVNRSFDHQPLEAYCNGYVESAIIALGEAYAALELADDPWAQTIVNKVALANIYLDTVAARAALLPRELIVPAGASGVEWRVERDDLLPRAVFERLSRNRSLFHVYLATATNRIEIPVGSFILKDRVLAHEFAQRHRDQLQARYWFGSEDRRLLSAIDPVAALQRLAEQFQPVVASQAAIMADLHQTAPR